MLHIFTSCHNILETDNLSSLEGAIFASILYPNQQVKDFVSKEGLYFKEIQFGEVPLLVASRFKFYKNLKKAVTPSSNAYYLLWHEEASERFGFLLQYLPPNSVTSRHYHTEQTESFSILEGMLSLETSEGTFALNAGGNCTVRPGIVHQLRTKETPSLTVIQISNVNYRDHHLVKED